MEPKREMAAIRQRRRKGNRNTAPKASIQNIMIIYITGCTLQITYKTTAPNNTILCQYI